ncbi:scoloptoxin SSD14-like [Diorhabda sublineata]|uniref:scoloptoxin SSD14-like n=1 Tax=Diorhabda sublineata TaxID=1163346 RepID=UPI0024E08A75|nr:scoloptoxin SSD14-like [Diorhabda sublineata]
MKTTTKRVVVGVTIIVVIAIIIVVAMTVTKDKHKVGAVASSGHGCADIGVSILGKGGNAVDAAIATLFCEGVMLSESMGLGGGFFLVLYNKTTGETWALDARETAPSASGENMYKGQLASSSLRGGRSVAVPGELRGYMELYNRFGGGVPWKDLIQPTIDICKKGQYVTKHLESRFNLRKEMLWKDPIMRETFFDKKTNDTYKFGDYVKRPRMAKTLEIIANEGGNALHDGSLTSSFVEDVKNNGGIITIEDMKNYKPLWKKPIKSNIYKNYTVISPPLPASGIILNYILNILSNFIDVKQPNSIINNQRIVESFKFGYAKRTVCADPDYFNFTSLIDELSSNNYAETTRKLIKDNATSQDPYYYGAATNFQEDHGTSHVSVLSSQGDAVSVTSTINFIWGAGFQSNSTGIILNDSMDDFSQPETSNGFGLPPSEANFIKPGKRPMSSMTPVIVLDGNKNVVLVPGGAGGSKITTALALTIIKHLWFDKDLATSINEKRLHHQLIPMKIIFEEEYKTKAMDIVNGLEAIGHKYDFKDDFGFAAVTAISKNFSTGDIIAVTDKRRPGSVAYVTA